MEWNELPNRYRAGAESWHGPCILVGTIRDIVRRLPRRFVARRPFAVNGSRWGGEHGGARRDMCTSHGEGPPPRRDVDNSSGSRLPRGVSRHRRAATRYHQVASGRHRAARWQLRMVACHRDAVSGQHRVGRGPFAVVRHHCRVASQHHRIRQRHLLSCVRAPRDCARAPSGSQRVSSGGERPSSVCAPRASCRKRAASRCRRV
jgi:hypothetical protein